MNGTCQYNEGCGNPATTTFSFFGRDYRLCSTCEQELQPKIAALERDAWKAADQATGLLAGHFGISIQQAAPFAQALVGQVASDTMTNIRQEAHQQTQPIPAPGPPPSADHPHPADWACDDLCRTVLPAAPPAPRQAIPGGWSPPLRKTPAAAPRAIQGAVVRPRTSTRPKPGLTRRKLWAWGISCGAAFVAGIAMMAAPVSNSALAGWGMVIMLASLIVPALAALFPALERNTQAHYARQARRPPLTLGQQAARRRRNYALGLGAMAAVDLGLRAANAHSKEKLAGVQAHQQQQDAQRQAEQQHQELLDAVRQSGQPVVDPTAALLERRRLSPVGQRRRKELGW